MRVAMGLRCTRSTAKRARSNSTTCCRPSTSWRRRRRCSTPARGARNCRRAILTTVPDDSRRHLQAIKDNALLSKFAGGLGNDWTACVASARTSRAPTASQPGGGAVPESGQRHRRRGQPGRQAQGRGVRLPGNLAPRHRGIPRAAQEHRRRPSPHARHEHGELDSRPVHEARRRRAATGRCSRPSDLPGSARHVRRGVRGRLTRAYEEKAARGEIKLFKKMPAAQLWRKMLTMLFETGHPWITFKDPCNVRSPQQHVGVVHCSEPVHGNHAEHQRREIAVCNLGSVNLARPHETGRRQARARPRQAQAHRHAPPCACSTT